MAAPRTARGRKKVSDEDAWEFRKRRDSIARSSWQIKADTPISEDNLPGWCERAAAGESFDIPYGCLLPRRVNDLLVAGRCISAGPVAQSSLEVQQTRMSTGQAAGAAAALSLQARKSPHQLPARSVVDQLRKDRDVEPAFEILRRP